MPTEQEVSSGWRPQSLEDFKRSIEARYRMIVERESQMPRLFVLTARRLSSQIRRSEDDGSGFRPRSQSRSFTGLAQTMVEIAKALEAELKVPVVDETGLSGEFDFAAYSEHFGREAVLDWVHQLGLELSEAVRPIELLVVRRTQ